MADFASGQRGEVLVFVHIPKTAGTTVRTLLARNEPGDRTRKLGNVFKGGGGISTDLLERLRDGAGPDLRGVRVLTGHLPLGIRDHLRMYLPEDRAIRCFTFLREPVDRTLSHFFAIRELEELPGQRPPLAADATLDDALAGGYIHDNLQTRMLSGLAEPFGEVNEEMLEQAKRNLREELAFFGLTERFDESLVLAKQRLGFSTILHDSSGRVNAARPRGDAVPNELIEAARRANRYDLELYAHAQELFDGAPERAELDFDVELAALRAAKGEGDVDLQVPKPAGFRGNKQEWRMLLHARATLLRLAWRLGEAHRRYLTSSDASAAVQKATGRGELEVARTKMRKLDPELMRLKAVAGSRPMRDGKRNGRGRKGAREETGTARRPGRRKARKVPAAGSGGRRD